MMINFNRGFIALDNVFLFSRWNVFLVCSTLIITHEKLQRVHQIFIHCLLIPFELITQQKNFLNFEVDLFVLCFGEFFEFQK